MSCCAIMLDCKNEDSEQSVVCSQTINNAYGWGEYIASDRCSTPSVFVAVLPATIAPYREPADAECAVLKYAKAVA